MHCSEVSQATDLTPEYSSKHSSRAGTQHNLFYIFFFSFLRLVQCWPETDTAFAAYF